MSVHLFGIRHHGVGSTRALIAALEELQPDCILIEGPPDADPLIPMAAHAGMQPPVAILVYNPDRPQQAAWYPFTVYSPEWQAIQYGLRHNLPVNFMDLPYKHQAALKEAESAQTETHGEGEQEQKADPGTPDSPDTDAEAKPPIDPVIDGVNTYDPLQHLAELAGETDGERWWNRVVEETRHPAEIFAAIQEAMTALRSSVRSETANPRTDAYQYREALREAWMRKTVRGAEKKYKRIAVICGAWHTPAVSDRTSPGSDSATDNALLKNLPAVKSVATFAPWTYGRIAQESGYGAGIVSPGWYHHLWQTQPENIASVWLAQVAALLRKEGLLASTAQVIDAVRLAETVASLRGREAVGLDELNESSIAVFGAGRTDQLDLIRRELIISDRMGSIPPDAPAVPLQQDLNLQQKRLRLKLSMQDALDLDLRSETDLARSHLFHRLTLLGIQWAQPTRNRARSSGTFHEYWDLNWTPELDIRVIEQSIWGNTVEGAASQFTRQRAEAATTLSEVSGLIQSMTLADLPAVMPDVLRRLDELATTTTDLADLLKAVPDLANVFRYGNVRSTDTTMIGPVLEALIIRLSLGLPVGCSNINDEVASRLNERIEGVQASITLIERHDLAERWRSALRIVAESIAPQAALSKPNTNYTGIHPLLSGSATRILFRAGTFSAMDAARLMQIAFSPTIDPAFAAQWLEGFLHGMEQILVRDDALFTLIDEWVVALNPDSMEALLPVLRRTFSTFGAPARRMLSERVKRGSHMVEGATINEGRAALVLPLMRQILGLES